MLSQSKPPLFSLKVHRTVEAILTMDATETPTAPAVQTAQEPIRKIDHSEEIKQISQILEQQCFSFVAFRNKIQDARKTQKELMGTFHEKANNIEASLNKIKAGLTKKVDDLNKRFDAISKNLALKPTFRQILPPNDFGRVTGISVCDELILCTTAAGYIFTINRSTFSIEKSLKYSDTEALFHPFIYKRSGIFTAFFITSLRHCINGLPGDLVNPRVCCNNKVESFTVNLDSATRDLFEIALGEIGQIEFCLYKPETDEILHVVGTTKKLKGNITSMVVDSPSGTVYALSSRRMFYSISGQNFGILNQAPLDRPAMQLFVTECFIVFSMAPDDIVIAEKNRDKLNRLYTITIKAGLRRLFAAERSLLVITKDQTVERRRLCDMTHAEQICEPGAADYNEEEYIGVVAGQDNEIFLSHGSQVSYWS